MGLGFTATWINGKMLGLSRSKSKACHLLSNNELEVFKS